MLHAQALGAQNCWTVSIPPIKKGCLSTCHVPLQPRQTSAVFPQCYYSLLLLGDVPFPVERISFSKPCLVLPIIFISPLKCLWCLGLELEDELVTLIAMEIQSRFPNRPWA